MNHPGRWWFDKDETLQGSPCPLGRCIFRAFMQHGAPKSIAIVSRQENVWLAFYAYRMGVPGDQKPLAPVHETSARWLSGLLQPTTDIRKRQTADQRGKPVALLNR